MQLRDCFIAALGVVVFICIQQGISWVTIFDSVNEYILLFTFLTIAVILVYVKMSERPKLTYETYLRLDKVLDSQYLESEAAGNRVDEEHLFIIVHQAFEIWFKQILEDLGGVITTFQIPDFDDRKHLSTITKKLGRIALILKLVVQHFEILETMPPAVFLNFRKYLKSGSGFESLQFRLIENRFGLQQLAREAVKGQVYKDKLNSTQKMKAVESEEEPSLFTVVKNWLKNVFTTCTERDSQNYLSSINTAVSKWAKDENTDENQKVDKDAFEQILTKETYKGLYDEDEKRHSLSFEAFHGALLISLYQDEPEFQMAYMTLKLIMDVDCLISKWRHTHVLMVHRMLGRKMGTGGSSGYDYLKSTNQDTYRVFIELFNLSAFLIPDEYKAERKPYTIPKCGKISSPN
ncbi:tryptophan 2,3-dioxygenase-like [Crassostrea virginica]